MAEKFLVGFTGNESFLNERNWENNETILSGDIGIPGDSTDNSYSVIYCEYADSTTILDGFTVTGGNANNENSITNSFQKNGGGFFLENDEESMDAIPHIRNCLFINNSSVRRGGGIYVRSTNTKKSVLKIFNIKFERNFSQSGGAISIENSSNLSDHIINKCIFNENQGSHEGSGIYYKHSNGTKNLLIKKCNFSENYSSPTGICIKIDETSVSSIITVDSCKFENNYGTITSEGTIISYYNFTGINSSGIKFNNCTTQNNTSSHRIIFIH